MTEHKETADQHMATVRAKAQAEYDAKILKAEKEYAIRAALPEAPYTVTSPDMPQPWVNYNVNTFTEAFELLGKFERLPFVDVRASSFRMVQTMARVLEQYDASKVLVNTDVPQGTPFVRMDSAPGRTGQVSIEIFSRIAGRVCKVAVRVKSHTACCSSTRIQEGYPSRSGWRNHYPDMGRATLITWATGGDGHVDCTFVYSSDAALLQAIHSNKFGSMLPVSYGWLEARDGEAA